MPRPLAEDEFWALVSTMQGCSDEEALGRLTDALRARPAKDVVAFQERLARVLFELDREVLAYQPVRFRGDPPDQDPIPLSDDSFLYLRTGIVVAGRATCERVLADPTVLADGEWDECEDLLYVAEEVLGDDVDTKVSYETGSNTDHWAPPEEPEREPWDQGLRSVSVHFRDLSQPIEGERPRTDGAWEPFVFYVPPTYVEGELGFALSTDLARIVTTNGGLPEQLAAAHVVAVIDFADDWQLEAAVGEPTPSEVGPHREVRVRVAVSSEAVRGWGADERRAGLSAVAAACALAVLPDTHRARPALDELRRNGAELLPG
jgi:Protein of unknown function (DUF4240)